MEPGKKEVLLKLRKIAGQVRGLQRMVQQGAPCPDILIQVAAVTSAIKKVETVIVQAYMKDWLEKTETEPGARRGETLKDFQKAMSRYIDWA